MSKTLAWIVPISAGDIPGEPGAPDQGLPVPGDGPTPQPPIALPPAVWPGVPAFPATPSQPIALPPGTVYPPLPPSVSGKVIVLVWIPGVGKRWLVIDADSRPQPTPQ